MTARFLQIALTAAVLGCPPLLAGEAPPAGLPVSVPAALTVEYVYSPTCVKCREAEKIVDAVEKKYGARIRVLRYNTADDAGLEAAMACEARHGLNDSTPPPKVFAGRQYFCGLDAITQKLEAAIGEELAFAERRPAAPEEGTDSGLSHVARRFSSFTAGAIAVAGLVDGVNPCAFTTIVFMLSMLAYLGKSRREMAVVSVGFTVSMFLTYMLLGVGLFWTIKTFAVSRGISAGLTYVVAAMTFALAGWSFFDAIRFARAAQTPKWSLGLPQSVKRAIHRVIRTGLKTPSLLIGSLAVGCLVSLLESLCTGQVYLPAIMVMIRTTQHRLEALGYLVLYNLMFVLPLVVLAALSVWGVGSQRLGNFLGRRLWLAKVGLGVLFAGLGGLLLATA